MGELIEEQLTGSIIGAFYEVYNTLGFGFLEHIYVMAMERELIARGHHVDREMTVTSCTRAAPSFWAGGRFLPRDT